MVSLCFLFLSACLQATGVIVAGTNDTMLSPRAPVLDNWSLSSDGKYIVYTVRGDSVTSSEVRVVSIDTPGKVLAHFQDAVFPQWSPDSTKLAMVRQQHAGDYENSSFRIADWRGAGIGPAPAPSFPKGTPLRYGITQPQP